MAKGKLIVIESGTDGSGKSTQFDLLYDRLKNEGHNVIKVKFPDYESDSSALVRMYLKGEFGENPKGINLYAASTFYAVDRFASYQQKWKKLHDEGAIILADRYTTSNMIHQASKIDSTSKKKEYLEWLSDLEFNKFKLPEPDLVIFLDMPVEYSVKFIEERGNQDIHENDLDYLQSTYNNAVEIADIYNWQEIKCTVGAMIKTIDQIHQEVYEQVNKIL
ncbi:dTMP kinase [Natronospora cellulosivora (SeqCode)]